MTDSLTARHLGGDRFAVDVRAHTITVDQPTDAGGEDAGPTPTELFVAGLASCVAFYARRYLERHRVPGDGLSVVCDYAVGGRPARITELAIRITPPAGLPPERREAFLAVASHCTVHNTLAEPPPVKITLVPASPV
jgi:putative redox protein